MQDVQLSEEIKDVIIVGAGPAGSAAAMVLARMRRSILIIDDGKPRNVLSHGMHNYLSRDGALPTDFLKIAHKELSKYKVSHVKERAIEAKKLSDDLFQVNTSSQQKYYARRLLIATGVTDIIPDIPGMQELWGCGVYHCPYCDGFELCNLTIGLYARNFNGFGMAVSLAQLSKNIILFTDGAGYLKKAQIAQLIDRDIRVNTLKLKELTRTKDKLTCITMKDGSSIPCDALFVHNGHHVNNQLLLQLGARTTKKGAAITNLKQACSIPGVYTAGDAAIDIHFVAVAAAEGTKAAVAIHDSLMHIDNTKLRALTIKNEPIVLA